MFEDLTPKEDKKEIIISVEDLIKAFDYNMEEKQKLIDKLILDSLEKAKYIMELEELVDKLMEL